MKSPQNLNFETYKLFALTFRQKGSHGQYLNLLTGDVITIKQESPLKKAYVLDILYRIDNKM